MTEFENKTLPSTQPEEDEIDLIQLAKELWNGRKQKVMLCMDIL